MLYTFSLEKKGVLNGLSFQFVIHARESEYKQKWRYSGGYSTKVPPLSIPNREVKLRHADGTAYCGRVGSCRFKRGPRGRDTSGIFAFIHCRIDAREYLSGKAVHDSWNKYQRKKTCKSELGNIVCLWRCESEMICCNHPKLAYWLACFFPIPSC